MRVALLFTLVACTELNTGAAPADASRDIDACVTGSPTDNLNCGACGNACTQGRTCQSGSCSAAVCVSGRANCDHDETNGCETASAIDTSNCGRCGIVCSFASASAMCVAGACRVATCESAFGDCDGDASNGCERALSTSVAHCGACGHGCVASHATPACVAGACRVSVCDTGFADCDGDASNGCEAGLATSLAHCGGCGNVCPTPGNGSATCVAGACGFACDEGFDRATGACLAPGVPRLVAPLSPNAVNSHRPTLRWVLGAGTDGTRVELCRDRAMTTDCQFIDAMGSSAHLATALRAGVWFWRARGRNGATTLSSTSVTWHFVVDALDVSGEGSRPMPLDLEGDGLADLVVGASHAAVGTIDFAGMVSVFPGSPGGVPTSASRVLEGAVTNDLFGESVANAGDVNGDGFADLLVGAPVFVGGGDRRHGSLSVFHGGPMGVGAAAARVLRGTMSGFGGVIASAGDVNGDGYGDIAVALIGATSGPAVGVFWGGSTGLGATAAQGLDRAPARADASSLSGAVDVNSDGFADLIVGAAGAVPGGRMDAGRVSLYLGSATGLQPTPAQVFEGGAPGDLMGTCVAGIGDVNGDGFEDIALASPGARAGAGIVGVYLGGATGFGSTPERVIEGGAPGDRSGTRVAGLGDVNGDGFDDLAIGAPNARANAGTVSVFLGGAMGPGATPARVFEGTAPESYFGTAIAGLGDVNGDGYSDFALGEPRSPARMTEGVGVVRVFLGSAAGPVAAPAHLLEGRVRNGLFGESVAQLTRARRLARWPS